MVKMESLERASSGSDVLLCSAYFKSLFVIVVVQELDLNVTFNGALESVCFLGNCFWVAV